MSDVSGVTPERLGSLEFLRPAAEALLRGDAHFQAVLDVLPAAVYITDADGRITYYNDAAAALWGHRPELGKSEWCGSWKLYWPDGTPLPHDQCPMALALKERRPIRGMEAVAERPDGTRVQFIANPQPLYDPSGAFIGAVNLLVDIDQLRTREAELERIFDRTPFMLARCGRDLTYRFVSQAYANMIGRSPSEVIGRPIVEIVGEEAFKTILPHVEDMLQGKRVEYEDRVRIQGAGERFLHVVYTPEFDRHGKIDGWIASIHDVTERRRAEEDSRRLALIVESSDDAIVSMDLDGVITSWNRGGEEHFGYTAEETIGQPVTMLIPPERHGEERGILDRIRRGERVHHYETVRRHKSGRMLDVSLTVSPVKDGAGRIIGASKIARDITERKVAQEQQKLLVNEMKHRIKNTLATVQAIAAQTLRDISDSDRHAFIARLQALAGAHDLLTSQNWQQASLKGIVERALEPFQETHHKRFLIDGPDDISLDAQRSSSLAMALHELATNATKFGALSNDSGQVRVTWERGGEPNRVRLRWQEIGGPAVVPPEEKGFGSRLIERALNNNSDKAKLDFAPDGVVCTLELTA